MSLKLIPAVLIVAIAVSCGKNKEESPAVAEPVQQAKPVEKKECFLYAANKDTVTLTLTRTADNASGELQYNLFEKDGNFGTFSGTFVGDTLYADYTFESEGMTSVREAVFLRKGDKLYQGDGEIIIGPDKVTYSNPKALSFGNSIVLEKRSCE